MKFVRIEKERGSLLDRRHTTLFDYRIVGRYQTLVIAHVTLSVIGRRR
jgi:hypothetical protein